ncbi:MAG: aldo/keto reductase, partial [Candidatus Microthrix parvicella]|nr:aldo/keto reductase [Candidatus Microthrix parvicella]
MSPVPNIRLNDGAQIPQLGFGMSRIDPDEAKGATLTAL